MNQKDQLKPQNASPHLRASSTQKLADVGARWTYKKNKDSRIVLSPDAANRKVDDEEPTGFR